MSTTLSPENNSGDSETPEKQYTQDGALIVKLSERATATIKEIDGRQSLQADGMIGAMASPLSIMKHYALFGLQSLTINGENVTLPALANDQAVYLRAQKMSARELTVLMAAYCGEYMDVPFGDPENLKN